MQTLKSQPIWLVWNKDKEKGKLPINAQTGGLAQSNNPSTWSTYSVAEEYKAHNNNAGLGFMFADGLCGIDIDGHHNGRNKYAQEVLELFSGTYAELSPSGSGYHIICRVRPEKLPVERRENGKLKLAGKYYVKNPQNELECYIGGLTHRFFTFTGNHVDGNANAVTDQTEEVLEFLDRYMQRGNKRRNVLDVARNAKNGAKFIALYDNGDISAYNDDKSSADMALCNMLAFYLKGDPIAIDNAFRQSALYRKKWEREDYRWTTINNAIEATGGVYYSPQTPEPAVMNPVSVTVKPVAGNLFTIEAFEAELKKRGIEARYNVITNSITVTGTNLSQENVLETLPIILYSELRKSYKGVSMANVTDFLTVVASTHRYNPVLDYFRGKKWDGNDRLESVYKALGLAPDDTLSRTLIKKWLWQGIALLHNDPARPFGADGVLTLAGGQGIGKTTFFRKVSIRPDFFREGQSINNYDKDSKRRCLTTWIAELGELDCTFKSDMGMLKAFITNDYDEYRLPYGRADKKAPRRTNLGATVNGTEFLIDPTGNRRFWTIPLEFIDLDLLNEIDFTQVWLQVWEEYAKKDLGGFRLERYEQSMLAERNSKCEKALPAEHEVRDIIDSTASYSWREQTVTEFKAGHDVLRSYSVNKISAVLNKLGIEQEVKRIGGVTKRVRNLPF